MQSLPPGRLLRAPPRTGNTISLPMDFSASRRRNDVPMICDNVDGCMDPTEVQRRLNSRRLLEPDDLPPISELLHQKWKEQLASAPTWMRHLIPKEPPAEFWTAEYYQVVDEFVERSTRPPPMKTTGAELEQLIAKHPIHTRDGLSLIHI